MSETRTDDGNLSGTGSSVEPPVGFRFLVAGERIRKGDVYCQGSGHPWHKTRLHGTTWYAEGHYLMARRKSTKADKPKKASDQANTSNVEQVSTTFAALVRLWDSRADTLYKCEAVVVDNKPLKEQLSAMASAYRQCARELEKPPVELLKTLGIRPHTSSDTEKAREG